MFQLYLLGTNVVALLESFCAGVQEAVWKFPSWVQAWYIHLGSQVWVADSGNKNGLEGSTDKS